MGLFSPSYIATAAICGGLLISVIALLFNRIGWINVAGLLITVYVFASVAVVIVNAPGGLSTTTLGLFYTLVFVEVLAASLLPVNWVLLAALVNIVFVMVDFTLQHKTPEFAHILATDFYTILIRILVLHIFVVLVLWLWVSSAMQAIKRADRAEELAQRERQIQELQQADLRQKEELENGVRLILQTHVQLSNGDFQARAPLSQDNLLWQVAFSLNNLIVRLQKYSQAEAELKHIREIIVHLTGELQEAKRAQHPIQISITKTFLDPFLQEVTTLSHNKPDAQAQSSTRENDDLKSTRSHPRYTNNRDV